MNWARSLCMVTAVGLVTQGSLFAWNYSTPDDKAPTNFKADYPFSQDQGWYTEESYLLFKPTMGNMWYGNRNSFKQIDANSSENRIKVENPEYDWSSGVRIGIGRYLPNHDGWDTSLTATYFYSNLDDKTKVNPNHQEGFNSSYIFNNSDISQSGAFGWRLNYWTVDFAIGRLFQMSSRIVFHPYLGLRGSWQYQHASTKAVQNLAPSQSETVHKVLKASIDNDFWGVGPRFGTHFIYYFENRFSFLANLSASLLVGGQKLKNNQGVNSLSSLTGPATRNTHSHDNLNVIRTNLEGMVGLGWEKWMRNRTVRIAPSVCLEGSLWFAMNQLYNIYPTASQFDNVESRRQGNLGLMGVSFNLQVDF